MTQEAEHMGRLRELKELVDYPFLSDIDWALAKLQADNPDLDGTDAASPAWWRGHEAGSLSTVQVVSSWLAADYRPAGKYRPEVEELREKVLALKAPPHAPAVDVEGIICLVRECMIEMHSCGYSDAKGYRDANEYRDRAKAIAKQIRAALTIPWHPATEAIVPPAGGTDYWLWFAGKRPCCVCLWSHSPVDMQIVGRFGTDLELVRWAGPIYPPPAEPTKGEPS